MVKIRRGWYLSDKKLDDEELRKKEKIANELLMGQEEIMKQGDKKIARRHLQSEQQKILKREALSRTQQTFEMKQKEVEIMHKLATELSRRKNEEINHKLQLSKIKSPISLQSNCALHTTRSSQIEGKAHLEANQAKLLQHWYQDENVTNIQQIKEEKKKRDYCIDIQKQLADNNQRYQENINDKKNQDHKMMEQMIQQSEKENMKLKKRKDDKAFLLRAEIAESIAAREVWKTKYKKALKDEDERIARIIAEKEAWQKEIIDKEIEFRAVRERTIDKVARNILDDVYKKTEREKIINELYEEEQKDSRAKEPVKLALRKQCAMAQASKEMAMRQKAIAERKMENEAVDIAITRYLHEEWKRDVEREKKRNEERRIKNIQYGKELKEAIMDNKVSYAMNILDRQSEIHTHEQNMEQSFTANGEKPSDKKDDKISKKEICDM